MLDAHVVQVNAFRPLKGRAALDLAQLRAISPAQR